MFKPYKPFGLLCIGRTGVGKTSLIKNVFGLPTDPMTPQDDYYYGVIEQLERFEVKIETLLSPWFHHHLSIHVPRDNDAFVEVKRIGSEEHLELKDGFDVIWLCIETPPTGSGGRLFEQGDLNLLRLAHKKKIPIVIVFTKYDLLVRSMWKVSEGNTPEERAQQIEQGRKAADEEFKKSVQDLEILAKELNIPMPDYAKVSVHEAGFHSEGVSALSEATLLAILFDTFNNSSR